VAGDVAADVMGPEEIGVDETGVAHMIPAVYRNRAEPAGVADAPRDE
jgi:hypothetical protein